MKFTPLIVFVFLPILVSAQAPTSGATNFSASNFAGNGMKISWTRGNGANVLVVASTSATFNGNGIPADGTDYNHSTTFGNGDPVGTNNFVVYRGASASVTISGLAMSTTYYFRVYEFNGVNFATQYFVSGVLSGNGATLSPPTTGSSSFAASVTGNSAALSWQRGDGTRSLVILQAGVTPGDPSQYVNYSANVTFGSGDVIGSGRVVYFNSSSSVNVINLQPNTVYYYKIVEANGTSGPVFDVTHALTGSFTTATAPTAGSTTFSSSTIEGNRFNILFQPGNGTQRLIVARQDNPVTWAPANGVDYNVSSAFGAGDNLGNNTFAIAKTTGGNASLTGLTPATTYYVAIFEYNGSATNTWYLASAGTVLTGQATTLSPPSSSAGGFSFNNVLGYSVNVNLVAGNGSQRLVLAKAGSPVTDVPVNLVSYNANSSFTSATALGASKIVYDGSGTAFTMTSLQPNTTYHFAVFEYNGDSGPVYKQSDPGLGAVTTPGKPTVAPTALSFSSVEGDRFTLSYTTGNGSGRTVIVKQGSPVDVFPIDNTTYSASTTFGTTAAHIGNGNYVIQNNTALNAATSTTVTGLAIGQTYYVAVIESNGTGTETLYMSGASSLAGSKSTLSAPTQQAMALSFSAITSNSVTVSWQNGNGNRRIVLIRESQAVQSLPADLSTYTFNSNYASSPALGTSKVVYDGTGTSVNVTNLNPAQYFFAVVEYNGNTRPVYRTSDPLAGSVNVGAKPTVPASNVAFTAIQGDRMSISCSKGDGISRMVIARAGAPVDAWPADFTTYTASGTFMSGSHLGGGNYVVGSGTATGFTVTGLQPSTAYYFAIVEFNGSGATSLFQLPANVATASKSTLSAPAVATSNFFANSVTGNSMQLTWTSGDGSGRLVIAKAGSPVDVVPANLTNASAMATFGSGTNFGGGNYAVYDNTSDNFVLTNLQPATTYHFASFEYNGSGSGKVYLTSPVARASFTTAPRPTAGPKNLSVTAVNGDRFSVSFTEGNGTRRLIVLHKGALVDTRPTDLTTYVAGAFMAGSQLGTGNYVTTLTTGNSAIITGLEPDTAYGVAVFELDGGAGNERYLATEYINQIVKTASPPSISTYSLLFNSLGGTSVNLSWTNGNGEGRMVVLRPYQPVTFLPVNLNSYGSASANYASTSNNLPNSHKHIFHGNQTSVTITNLTPGVTYHVAIFEYNGSNQPVYRAESLRGFFTTLPSSGLAIGGFDAITFCPAQQVDVPYYFTGVLNAGNQLSIELSDISGSFAAPMILGTQSTTNGSGFVTSTLPVALTEGSGYRLRVRSTNPALVSPDNGVNLQVVTSAQPTFAIAGGQTSSCGTPITLTASQPGYNLQWFKNGTAIPHATESSYVAAETGDYQVRIAGASGGCQLFSAATTITISQRPTFNFQFSHVVCANDAPIDLRTLVTPSGGTFSGTGITNGVFDATAAGVGQYIVNYTYVDGVSSCSYTQATTLQVAPLPQAPVTMGAARCLDGSVTLTASGGAPSDNYPWYSSLTGGSPVAAQSSGNFITPTLSGSTDYFVAINNGVCESTRTPVTATIHPVVAPPVVSQSERCDAGKVTLTASGAADGNYRWYTSATGNLPLAGESAAAFVTPDLSSSTNYFVSIVNGACESERTTAVAIIRDAPLPPASSNVWRCGTGVVQLSASSTVPDYRWYTQPTGGVAIVNEYGSTFDTPSLTSTTSYFVSVDDGHCESARTEVKAIVQSNPPKPTITSTGSVAGCGTVATMTAPAGYTYLWSTGETTQAVTTPSAGVFTVVVNDGVCSSETSDAVVVAALTCNRPPIVETTSTTTSVETKVNVNLANLISDPDNNVDLSTLKIIAQPASGATATVVGSSLLIDYHGVSFAGREALTIEVCDTNGACTQQQVVIEVIGDIVAYNGLSANGDEKNAALVLKYIDSLEETRRNKVSVFNRWGDVVWEGVNYDNVNIVFTGQNKSGADLPAGTYFYKIEFQSAHPVVTGYLSLKR